MNIEAELSKLPDIKCFMMLYPPWAIAIKAKGQSAWSMVEPLLNTLRGSSPQIKLFGEWAICVLCLAMIDAGEQVTANGVIEHIKTQGRNLIASDSLPSTTRKPLESLVNGPSKHFASMMEEPIARLHGTIQPTEGGQLPPP